MLCDAKLMVKKTVGQVVVKPGRNVLFEQEAARWAAAASANTRSSSARYAKKAA
jgi:hypothetical protein